LGLFDLFRRKPPIRDLAELADFIDANAAFLMQKGIYEYSRARAGHYAKVLFAEPEFQSTVEACRWRAYPLGLLLVTEMTEGALAPHAGDQRQIMLGVLRELALSAFDRYPVPAALGAQAWAAGRDDLANRLAQIGLHPPKRVIDIPTLHAERYFACMPIHEKLRGSDFPTIRNYLTVTLCNIHDELTKRMDGRALTEALTRAASPIG
jgi:hypothetical protein